MLWLAIHLPMLPLEALGDAYAFHAVTERRGARRWVVAAPQEAAAAPTRCGEAVGAGGAAGSGSRTHRAGHRVAAAAPTRCGEAVGAGGAAGSGSRSHRTGHDVAAAAGTDWSAVQVLRPDLRGTERRPRAEREAMKALAAWAYRYSSELIWSITEHDSDYGLPCALLWIEIGASLRLYGGLDALLADFDAAFAETGYTGQRGVAPTIEAAALLARAGVAQAVTERPQLPAALGGLPLQALDLSPGIFEALKAIGLSRIGELLELPAAALGRRHGPQLLDHLDRLLGRRPDARARYQLPPKYQRRFDLLGEVEHTEGLLFPLQRMTRELAEYLRARDTGLQEFRLILGHGRASGGAPQADTVLELRLATPAREPERLLRVLREQLARTGLPAAVRTLKLQAERFIEPSQGQGDLFDPTRGDEEAWSQLIEKLVARLGAEAVSSLGLLADHRPERCWQSRICEAPPATVRLAAAPAVAMPDTVSPLPPGHGVAKPWVRDGRLAAAPAPTVPDTVSPLPPRPVWLIDPPRFLPNAPKRLDGVERIEGGWWDGGDVMRDYYHADLHGGRFWVYQDRNTQAWYLQGIWA
ncbi:MAG: DNA polymerase Y family protein [Nevskia sp.]